MWVSMMRSQATAASYRSHLKMACSLAGEQVAWDTHLVSAAIRSRGKQEDSGLKVHKWACDQTRLLQVVRYARQHELEWLAVLQTVCYAFQFRVFA